MKPEQILTRGKQFLEHVIPALLKPARTLWHEVIGFMFIALALLPARSVYVAIRDLNDDPASLGRLVIVGIFVSVMLYFGITSFRRARKVSRS
ncbi:MAG: hypothetical protein EXQ52_10565 [Bryobacterales bacterium]|nr:hypothetical protein [Bryobacterales bacterium]